MLFIMAQNECVKDDKSGCTATAPPTTHSMCLKCAGEERSELMGSLCFCDIMWFRRNWVPVPRHYTDVIDGKWSA